MKAFENRLIHQSLKVETLYRDVHVATALDAAALALETFDDGLLGKSGTIGSPRLMIRKPIPPPQGRLFP